MENLKEHLESFMRCMVGFELSGSVSCSYVFESFEVLHNESCLYFGNSYDENSPVELKIEDVLTCEINNFDDGVIIKMKDGNKVVISQV